MSKATKITVWICSGKKNCIHQSEAQALRCYERRQSRRKVAAESVELFRRVMEGETMADLARESGLSTAGVRARVMRFAKWMDERHARYLRKRLVIQVELSRYGYLEPVLGYYRYSPSVMAAKDGFTWGRLADELGADFVASVE